MGNGFLDGHLHKPDTNASHITILRKRRDTNQNLHAFLQRRELRNMGLLRKPDLRPVN